MRSQWLFLAVCLAACGGPGADSPHHPFKVASPFPSRDAVEKLSRAAPTPISVRQVAAVPEWRIELAPESSPIEQRFTGLAFTKELRCVAREYGRLRAAQGVEPDERLGRFIVNACGFIGSDAAANYWELEVPAGQSDAAVIARLQGLKAPPELQGRLAGAWLNRKGSKAIVTLATGIRDEGVTATLADTDGRIRVAGSAAGVELVMALVNRGSDAVAECEPDRSVVLPSFAFTCTLAETDPWAWIEVMTKAPDHLLLHQRALLLGRRDTTTPLQLTRRPRSEIGGGDLSQVVIDGVNRTRASAGLKPLTLASEQSSTNARLAPQFFGAEAAHQDSASEQIALGTLAGWDVHGGVIRDGTFYASLLTGAKNAGDWLDYALEQPFGRYTLLQPAAEQIAIGGASRESVGGEGVLLTAYSFFGATDRALDERRVLMRLSRERAARNLEPPAMLPDMPSLPKEAALIHAGKRDPEEALGNVLYNESQLLGMTLHGWVVATSDLDRMPFPRQLFQLGSLALRAEVTTYRPEGWPWGVYLVMFIALASSQQQVATSSAPGHCG